MDCGVGNPLVAVGTVCGCGGQLLDSQRTIAVVSK